MCVKYVGGILGISSGLWNASLSVGLLFGDRRARMLSTSESQKAQLSTEVTTLQAERSALVRQAQASGLHPFP